MLKKILSFFGLNNQKEAASGPAKIPPAQKPEPRVPGPGIKADWVEPEGGESAGLPREGVAFLLSLIEAGEPCDLQTLPPQDRVFLARIMKKLNEGNFDIPMLPRAAIELSKVLSDPKSDAKHFVGVLESDPALSTEVLKVANSAYYGFRNPAKSVHDAVIRIGLNQVRAMLIMVHLRGKVLQAGSFFRESEWLLEFCIVNARMFQTLAADLRLEPQAAFTKGLLLHIEAFVIMGAAGESLRGERREPPTIAGLREAFLRFAPKVRELAMGAWGLDKELAGIEEREETVDHIGLQRAIINWMGGDTDDVELEGFQPVRVRKALEKHVAECLEPEVDQ